MKKNTYEKSNKTNFISKDEAHEMIESALRRHNRRSTISSVLGWILIGGYSFGLFQAVQNVWIIKKNCNKMLIYYVE